MGKSDYRKEKKNLTEQTQALLRRFLDSTKVPFNEMNERTVLRRQEAVITNDDDNNNKNSNTNSIVTRTYLEFMYLLTNAANSHKTQRFLVSMTRSL